jgi:hypothetical protein
MPRKRVRLVSPYEKDQIDLAYSCLRCKWRAGCKVLCSRLKRVLGQVLRSKISVTARQFPLDPDDGQPFIPQGSKFPREIQAAKARPYYPKKRPTRKASNGRGQK